MCFGFAIFRFIKVIKLVLRNILFYLIKQFWLCIVGFCGATLTIEVKPDFSKNFQTCFFANRTRTLSEGLLDNYFTIKLRKHYRKCDVKISV